MSNIFTSGFMDNRQKIIPVLANDWTISTRTSVKREYLLISSAATNIAFKYLYR